MRPEPRWIEPEPINVPQDFKEAIGGHPLVAETLYRRGYRTIETAQAFLDPDCYHPTSADELPDAKQAYEILADIIAKKGRILVWGDFDVDGQTSTTVLVEGLRGLGADVRFHIPVRGEESHGITTSVLQDYIEEGFDLLLTCDTGISEYDNIEIVRQAGIAAIVTDHHTVPEKLPPANANVNPQRLPEGHPLRTLPGVGVAYKLIEGFYNYRGIPFNEGPFQELTALGIVADLAVQVADTRYILQRGLSHLRHTERLGLQTLYQNAELNPEFLTESHIGFQITPRMNAVGRIADANMMVEFLTTKDPGRARVLGMQIEAMNNKRRFTTHQVERAAERMLQDSADDRRAPAIVLHNPEWPGGVVGIVANYFTRRYFKPAILLTGEDPIHGSARSVKGINVTEAIGTQAHLLNGYGGHPMAAGMSFPASAYPAFKHGLLEAVERQAQNIDLTPEIEVHSRLSLSEINLDLISEIQRLAPFGPGNPALNFAIDDLALVSVTEVGQTGDHRQVIAVDQHENQQKFIWWSGAEEPLPEATFDLLCHLSQSDYKGLRQVSAEWVAFRLSERGLAEVKQRRYDILDLRQDAKPVTTLADLSSREPDMQIWGEGPLPQNVNGVDRNKLSPAKTLIIWTVPPSQSVLNSVIRTVKPAKVVLFGALPDDADNEHALMERVAGLVKYILNHKAGRTTVQALAGASAITPRTLHTVLQIWEAMGELHIVFDEDQVLIARNNQAPVPESIRILGEVLREQLNESQSFRRYYQQADLHSLFDGLID